MAQPVSYHHASILCLLLPKKYDIKFLIIFLNATIYV
jgi:hypothetical protein